MLLNASYHKRHEYIWLMGGDLNSFQGTELFYKINRVGWEGGGGGGHAWAHRGGGPSPSACRHTKEGGTSPSVLLTKSCWDVFLSF